MISHQQVAHVDPQLDTTLKDEAWSENETRILLLRRPSIELDRRGHERGEIDAEVGVSVTLRSSLTRLRIP